MEGRENKKNNLNEKEITHVCIYNKSQSGFKSFNTRYLNEMDTFVSVH